MARTILRVGAALWLLAGAAGLALAAFGTQWLVGVLPPLAIGADAVARAVGAFSAALLIVGAIHVAVLTALRTAAPWGYSAGILLAAFLAIGLLTLAAAAVTSAVTQPAAALGLVASGGAAVIGAAGYGLAGARLVGELRARPGI